MESKIAPMLVSGSYVGWVLQMMTDMFEGGRLKQTRISPKLAENEGIWTLDKVNNINGI